MTRTLHAALAAALWMATAAPASAGQPIAATTTASPVVVELFTSQGCSSCPPADALLGELAQRADVLALSMHVTYWDYIGWKDPFSLEAMSERQRAYVRTLALRSPYTPQMIVDGTGDVVGSYRDRVLAQVEGAAAHSKLPLGFERDGDGMSVVLPPAKLSVPATLWLVLFDRRHDTSVGRGENGGRRLVNFNVVRVFRALGPWDGAASTISLDLDPEALAYDGCAVIVQQGATGPILGAAAIDLKTTPGG